MRYISEAFNSLMRLDHKRDIKESLDSEFIEFKDDLKNDYKDEDFYEGEFMSAVSEELFNKYGIIEEPSAVGGIGSDVFRVEDDNGSIISSCELDLSEEERMILDIIEKSNNFNSAVNSVVNKLHDYCKQNMKGL